MFSVVIPLYNKEFSVESTIQSVLTQTFTDFEIVIVNDGSTDNSVAVVEGFQDPRIRLIHQKNQGVSAARNKGIEEAKFEWIAFLDADDLWKKNHLEEICEMMKKFPSEKVYATSFEFSDNREMYRHSRAEKIEKIENYFKEVIFEHIICSSAIAVNKKCFLFVGLFNLKINRGEDLDVWTRLARNFDIIKSKEITAIYRVETENKLTAGVSNYNQSILSLINLKGLAGYERKYFKKMILQRIKLNIRTGNLKEIVKIILFHNLELIK